MAYRPWNLLAEDGAGGAPTLARPEPLQPVPTGTAPSAAGVTFSPLEWQVVHLARNDGLSSLREPGRWAGLHRLIFGERADPRLADTRLEALRQAAVEAWHRGYALHPARIAAFLAAGFTKSHLEGLLAAIADRRGTPKARSFA